MMLEPLVSIGVPLRGSHGRRRDIEQLTRHNARLAQLLLTEVIPAILRDPYGAGDPKVGDLGLQGVPVSPAERGIPTRLCGAQGSR